MKLALVTTPPSRPSGIGDYVRHLLPHLRARCEVRVYVRDGLAGEALCGEPTLPVSALRPREHDQVLFQLGNARDHGFMAPLVRALGGVVALHDWVLFDLAVAAHPALARGGWKGHLLALREGGPVQARAYAQLYAARRAWRRGHVRGPSGGELAEAATPFVAGWHDPEPAGRWTAGAAWLQLPAGAKWLELELRVPPGRDARLRLDGRALAARRDEGDGMLRLEGALEDGGRLLELRAGNAAETDEQRARGDARPLGLFVERVALDGRPLDLGLPCVRPARLPELSDARFELPLNRSVVRFADAFVVHSEHLRRLVLEERNAPTPVGVLPHGAEPRWRDVPRPQERASLGLDASWRTAFVLSSFGGLQRHKRIGVLLAAMARARRERPDLRAVLVGGHDPLELDVPALLRAHGLEGAVHLTGHVPEEQGWRWIHAADLGVQLRGPSTGGTSGGVFATLSVGRGAIASDLAEQRELPESCVLRVAPGPGEVERLAALLVELRDAPARVAALERAARAFVEGECHWRLVAQRYRDLLEAFPTPRSARRSLVYLRLREAWRAGRARAARTTPQG